MNAAATDPLIRPPAPVLVIGVGSELRSDDAAGRRVAEALEAMAIPGVEVRSVHQLTPELATAFARRRLVVVVDASVDVSELAVATIDASNQLGSMSHHLDVGALMALAELLAEAPTRVATVAVPAHELGLGTTLSAATSQWLLPAVGRVAELCEDALADDD